MYKEAKFRNLIEIGSKRVEHNSQFSIRRSLSNYDRLLIEMR